MQSPDESKRVLTEVIKRQMAILGPDITLAKVKNVPGIEVDSAGVVVNVTGDTQQVLQELINQFVELSGLIVKKTMESILMSGVSGALVSGAPANMNSTSMPLPGRVSPVPAAPPEGYNIGGSHAQAQAQPVAQVVSSQPHPNVSQHENINTTTRDIEDLNKMLNNIRTS